MKVMLLGSTGMAGSMIESYFNKYTNHQVLPVHRNKLLSYGVVCDALDNADVSKLINLIKVYNPDVVINCIGLLVKESNDSIEKALLINSLFPHKIALACTANNIRFIHISTDCVFDGIDGPYNENSVTTETNKYGKSKAIGEIRDGNCLTIRTSIIGPDLDKNGTGLFNWVINQKNAINGYTKVMWNGITTLELAKQINTIIVDYPYLRGLYHLTTDEAISKYELLSLINATYNLKLNVMKELGTVSNKCLTNNRKAEYNPSIPPLNQQIEELFNSHLPIVTLN